MSRRGKRAPIVVGVDGAGFAGDAVDWATAEAATQHCPLRIVHVLRPSLAVDPYGFMPSGTLAAQRTEAERVLRSAVVRARSVACEVDVSALLLLGTATRELLGQATGTRLLVLGSRGRSGLRGLLAGSVSTQVAAHADCPVVVIHPNQAVPEGRAVARVIVGVDTTLSCAPAIGFAFRAARQRGIPLTAVHAWTADPPADLEAISGPPALAEALGRRAVERALTGWRDQFADVPIITKLVRADPARALVDESTGAAMVIVGSRGRGHLLGAVRGSVSQAVLHHAHSPIAIVQHDHDATVAPPDGFRRGLVA